MRISSKNRAPVLKALLASSLLLTSCAESGTATASHDSFHPAAISTPGTSDNPPVNISGYVDTSSTTQIK